jgi:Ca2+ transporting ATPase
VSSDEVFPAWAKIADETIDHYKSNKKVGLTRRREENKKSGRNVFPASPGNSIFDMVADQFTDWMVQVLLFAIVLGFVFPFFEGSPEERTSAVIALFVIVLILVLSFLMVYRINQKIFSLLEAWSWS